MRIQVFRYTSTKKVIKLLSERSDIIEELSET